jgi:hypothetical protein
VQDPAEGKAGAGRVLEGITVGGPVGDAVERLVGHDAVYPFFDASETPRTQVVDERLIGDNRRSPSLAGQCATAPCRYRPARWRHDYVDPCRDRRAW